MRIISLFWHNDIFNVGDESPVPHINRGITEREAVSTVRTKYPTSVIML